MESILTIVLTSSLIAAITTSIIDKAFYIWNENRTKEKERDEKVYRRLQLNLNSIVAIREHLAKLDDSLEYVIKGRKINQSSMDVHNEINRKIYLKYSQLVDETYKLIQSNIGLVKEQDLIAVNQFVKAYISASYVQPDPNGFHTSEVDDIYSNETSLELERSILGLVKQVLIYEIKHITGRLETDNAYKKNLDK
jgi:hypothetical protein